MADVTTEKQPTTEPGADDKQQTEQPTARPGRTMDTILSLKELAGQEPGRTGKRH